MEIRGDAASLVGGRLDGAHQKHLPVELAPAQAPGEAPCEGYLDEPERHEAGEEERREREPDPASRRRDCRPPLVRLEEKRRPIGSSDGEIDLVEAALAMLEAVLGPGEVAPLGARSARAQHLELRVVERVARPDQTRLVGVDDAPVRGPDLHTDHPLSEDALLDDRVEATKRRPVTVEDAVPERRLDDALPSEGRVLARVAERLALPDVPKHEEPAHEEHDQHEQACHCELQDGAHHRGRVGRGGPRGGQGPLLLLSSVSHPALSIAAPGA